MCCTWLTTMSLRCWCHTRLYFGYYTDSASESNKESWTSLHEGHQCHECMCPCAEWSGVVKSSASLRASVWKRRTEGKKRDTVVHILKGLCSSRVPFTREHLQQSSSESSGFSLGNLLLLVEEVEKRSVFLNKRIIYFYSCDFSHKPLNYCCSARLQYFLVFYKILK